MKSEQPSGFLEAAAPTEAEPSLVEPGQADPAYPEARPDDALEQIAAGNGDGGTLTSTMILAARLRQVEQHVPDAIKVGQAMGNLAGRLAETEKMVTHLSQQRAVAEVQMERQVRAVALDMAIKALPDSVKASAEAPDVMTTTAEAFLAWLKAGAQA